MQSERTEFVAVLVYDAGNNRRTITPYAIRVTHPEIAYQLAVAHGSEPRHGVKFVGLAELEVKSCVSLLPGVTQAGDPRELIRPKEQLSAFRDPRWSGVPCDAGEVERALREPPLLMELRNLESVDWGSLSHAYGNALDVPIDLRRLASSDAGERARALRELSGSIYHQGDIFDATAAAIPFLLQLAEHQELPDRGRLLKLVGAIAESCAIDPARVRAGWEYKKKALGALLRTPAEELAERQLACNAACLAVLRAANGILRTIALENDAQIKALALHVLQKIE